MRPVISATLAMLAYACALSAAEWAPEYEPQNGTGPAMLADAGRICVALAVWGEARGEGYDGQAAVATVIVNRLRAARAEGQDVDLCDVVLAPGQFLAVEAMPLPRMPWVRDPNGWNAALQVTDAAGRVCQNRTYRLSTGENSIEIPTDRLSAGFYVVHVHNEKGSFTKRLVVTE